MMKRLFDIVFSILALMGLFPVLVIIAILIAVNMGRPVFFRQVRPGKNAKPFKMIKFRTMRHAVDKNNVPLPDGERITSLGRFLRQTSLDELPELWNVLKGEMSIVGPRPLLMEYLPRYNKEQFRRHNVRPGITGLAQVNGRNALSWEEKFEMDVWYVDNQSLWLDIKIIFLTVKKVLIREGIAADGHATMPPFEGTKAKDESYESLKSE